MLQNHRPGLIRQFPIQSLQQLLGCLLTGQLTDLVQNFLLVLQKSIQFCFFSFHRLCAISQFLLSTLQHLFLLAEGILLFFEVRLLFVQLTFSTSQLITGLLKLGFKLFAPLEHVLFDFEFLVLPQTLAIALSLLDDFVTGLVGPSFDQTINKVANTNTHDPGETADDQRICHGNASHFNS